MTPVLFTVRAAYLNVTGAVTLTPNISEADSPTLDATVPLEAAQGEISDGSLSVQVVDSVGLDLGDTPLLYLVEYDTVPQLDSFWFQAPGDGSTVDLNTVLRVPSSGQINVVDS